MKRGKPVIPGELDAKVHSDAFVSRISSRNIVQQHLKEEVDVNTIVRRYGLTGTMPVLEPATAMYGDFTGIEDLESAMERVDDVRRRFAALPAEVRDLYRNDPRVMARELANVPDEGLEPIFGKPVVEGSGAPAPAEGAPAPSEGAA